MINAAWPKVQGRLIREGARLLFRRPFIIKTELPIISFTFDDFPRSAFVRGGAILKEFGVLGTYYASLGLMGKQAPPGRMFLLEDLKMLIDQGHELGCHTFDHLHSWKTKPGAFEDSLIKNRMALGELFPGASFKTFAYPISPPRPGIKRRVARYFACCRGGGRSPNVGTTDLTNLGAYFLEQARHPRAVKDLIDRNRRERGWLIFATHDVCADPSPFGCTPGFFEQVVQWALESGARVLPVVEALEVLRAYPSK